MLELCKACGSPSIRLLSELRGVPKAAQFFLDDISTYANDSCDLSIFVCHNCGHVQSSAPLVSYYKDVITAASLSQVITDSRLRVITHLESLLKSKSPSIVEIGCFKGDFLSVLASKGFTKLLGIENNSSSVSFALENSLNIIQGYLLDESFDSNSLSRFEILCCFNFLEHIPDPFLFLQKCKMLLKPGGFMYFTLPSFDFIKSTSCLHEFVPDHVSYFSKRSLDLLFRRASLLPVDIRSINNGNDLQIIARYDQPEIPCLDQSIFNNLIKSFNSILRTAGESSLTVAVWGAGHRTLTLLSQIDSQYLTCIVDSAPFKVNKYSPVSKLKIISPQMYRQSLTDILILALPGIYSAEVHNVVKSWSKKPSSILLLREDSIVPL